MGGFLVQKCGKENQNKTSMFPQPGSSPMAFQDPELSRKRPRLPLDRGNFGVVFLPSVSGSELPHVHLSHKSKPGIKMVYPEPRKELRATIYGWDCPFLTFINPGFDCGSPAMVFLLILFTEARYSLVRCHGTHQIGGSRLTPQWLSRTPETSGSMLVHGRGAI